MVHRPRSCKGIQIQTHPFVPFSFRGFGFPKNDQVLHHFWHRIYSPSVSQSISLIAASRASRRLSKVLQPTSPPSLTSNFSGTAPSIWTVQGPPSLNARIVTHRP